MSTIYKIVVLGTGGVGKSALSIQFVKGEFVVDYEPTIEENHKKTFVVDNKSIQVEILDTAGMETIDHLRQTSLRAGQGFLLIYSIDDHHSFDRVSEIYEDLLTTKNVSSVPLVICGNKCDLENQREVQTQEGKDLAERLHGKFYETSAKTKENVNQVFSEIVREIWNSGVKPPDSGEQTPAKKTGRKCTLL
ncbi:small GTP-binding protein [Histomonas meleagridis]|uniref:small GTP-binding protein n=1 Tax=Histomonas meleagridis TaxID=135588 RepID=UPI0035593B4C|nr:small GTP-binding protein [Histomonas meleagridis]KAH0806341.1 small GTP-binding protein [Histomonas meleagridis]